MFPQFILSNQRAAGWVSSLMCRLLGYFVWRADCLVILSGVLIAWLFCLTCRLFGYLVWCADCLVILSDVVTVWLSCLMCRLFGYLVWCADCLVILSDMQTVWLSCLMCWLFGYLVWCADCLVILSYVLTVWLSCLMCWLFGYLVWCADCLVILSDVLTAGIVKTPLPLYEMSTDNNTQLLNSNWKKRLAASVSTRCSRTNSSDHINDHWLIHSENSLRMHSCILWLLKCATCASVLRTKTFG